MEVLPGAGGGEIEDPLVAVLGCPARSVGEDPVGVRAGELGVRVDHLGLEPQAELHAEAPHVLGEGLEALRPGVGGDLPVAEARAVVAARTEPAVVDDIAFDAQGGGPVGQGREGGQVVAEVDGLPGVEEHRAGPVGMGRQGSQPGVGAGGQGVKALAPGEDHPRARVGLARPQGDLAGVEELAGAEQPGPLEGVERDRPGVARPGRVDAVDGAGAPAETGAPGGEPGGRVMAGAALPALPEPGTGGEGGAHEAPLAAVVARHVEQLGRVRGDRQDGGDLVDDEDGALRCRDAGGVLGAVAGGGLVRHGDAYPDEAAGLEADLRGDADGMGRVRSG